MKFHLFSFSDLILLNQKKLALYLESLKYDWIYYLVLFFSLILYIIVCSKIGSQQIYNLYS